MNKLIFLLKRLFKNKKHLQQLQEIARLIGDYYLIKNNGHIPPFNYEKTRNEIRDLGITRLQFKNNCLSITLTRCGLLIGRNGTNIDNLQKYLSEQLKRNIKLHIIEDNIVENLYPYKVDFSNY